MLTGLRTKTSGLVLDDAPNVSPITPTLLTDKSRWGNDGAFTNVTMVQLPSKLWVYELDGANAYVDCGHDASINFISQPFSALIWLYPTDISGNPYVIGDGRSSVDGWNLWIIGGGNLLFRTNQTAATQTSNSLAGEIITNTWTLVGCTRDGASGRVYINGMDRTDTIGVHIDPLATAQPVRIGVENDLSQDFVGYVALPHIYSYALSAGQINQRYEATRRFFGK